MNRRENGNIKEDLERKPRTVTTNRSTRRTQTEGIYLNIHGDTKYLSSG